MSDKTRAARLRRRPHAADDMRRFQNFSHFEIQLIDVDMHTFSHLRTQLIQLLIKRGAYLFELILVALSRDNLSDSTLDPSMHAFIWRFPPKSAQHNEVRKVKQEKE